MVELDTDNLRLIVADDGIGFDSHHQSEFEESQGWGLISITERAESVGADFKIESAPGQGTTVFIEVPR